MEYLGQGLSDKPENYDYSTLERADLLEAHLRTLKSAEVDIVSFDYSSLVVMESLRRYQENSGLDSLPRVRNLLLINGGLYADAHSHPWFTTPVLNSPMGRMGTWFAQRSRRIFGQMVSILWSRNYRVTPAEVDELYEIIRRDQGVSFLSRGAGFVAEHKRHRRRWDYGRLYKDNHDSIRFVIAGSEEDPFEHRQIRKAAKRLKRFAPDIRRLPGGHLTTSEHPQALAELIMEIRRTQ